MSRLKENLPGCHFTRLESRVGLGIPDALVAHRRGQRFVMIEAKVVQRGRQAGLSAHQVAFHAKHAELGCPTFIVIQYYPPGTLGTRGSRLLLYRGSQAIALAQQGLDVPPVASWPSNDIQWQEFEDRLLDISG